VTTSRRYLYALFGLVLPVAAFTASSASAATSTAVHHKATRHHVSVAVHHVTRHHTVVHRVSHRTTRHVAHKVAAS
jgi:hypothetical protein